jgi:polyhydroxyalkanoate synthesis regulator phasin
MNENEMVLETMNEGVKETITVLGNESLAYNEVVDALDQMIDAGKLDFVDEKNRKKLDDMRKHAKTPMYNGSTMTKLEADILFLEMKARNGMSDTRFNDLLSLLQKFVPSPNELPQNTYEAKQMICPLGL